MKILYHHRTQAEDGQAVHIRSLIEAFRSLDHEVREVALVPKANGEPAPVPEEPNTESKGRRFSPWAIVGAMPRFAREMAEYAYGPLMAPKIVKAGREQGPDVLYERYAFANGAGLRAARTLKVPLILEVNSPMVVELSKTRGLSFPRHARRFEERVFRGADRVCVVTAVLGDMLAEMGVERDRLIVTPNGVHPHLYTNPDRAAARHALGLTDVEGPVLGFTGYYRDWHRLDLVLEGMADASMATAHLVLIGEGPAEDHLRRRALELGVMDRFHLAGTRPHSAIPALLPAFDVGLVPAINPYASPLKLHEYMAAGLACVAPDQPNLREVLTDGVDARLVTPDDGDAMLHALAELCADSGLRARLGAAAQASIVTQDLTWTGNARRVVRAVEELQR